MVWAKSSDFTDHMGGTGPIYTAPDGETRFSYANYQALPDWYKDQMVETSGAMGPIYTAPDGETYTYAEYEAMPDTEPHWEGKGDPDPVDPDPVDPDPEEPEPEPEPEPGEGDPDPVDPDPEEPEPGPGTDLSDLTATKLKNFMASDPLTDEQAEMALLTALAMVEGYTRGNHKDTAGNLRSGLDAVVLTVAARIGANPGQIVTRDSAGPFTRSRGQGFNGFTLAELAVLNRYRKRAV